MSSGKGCSASYPLCDRAEGVLRLAKFKHSPYDWGGTWTKLRIVVVESANPKAPAAPNENALRAREAEEVLELVESAMDVSEWKQLLCDALDMAVRGVEIDMVDRLLQAGAWIGHALDTTADQWQWESLLVVLKHFVSQG